MEKRKTQKGITLIALIITIVVLLILAAVAISSITNDGVLQYASNAATDYNQAVANEQDMLQQYVNYLNNHTTGSAGSTGSEGEGGSGSGNTPSGGSTTTGGIAAGAYTVGQSVTLTDTNGVSHEFWVIEASAADATTVKLLAKERIDTTTLLQSASASGVAFSSTNYWPSDFKPLPYDLVETGVPDSGHTAALAAYNYGAQFTGATGRLMYESEADALNTDDYSDILWGTASTNGYVNYWLGSASIADSVCLVNGDDGYLSSTSYAVTYGVRPVLIVSKS